MDSVLAQTVRPEKWVIVSDGSTDRTDDLVRAVARDHCWVKLLRMPEHRDRNFAAKAVCFNAAYDRLRMLRFDLIGNLDADITLPARYLQFLMEKFSGDPALGVAGTPFVEDCDDSGSHTYDHRFADPHHVSGACQIFRRQCFEEVGGYVPIKGAESIESPSPRRA